MDRMLEGFCDGLQAKPEVRDIRGGQARRAWPNSEQHNSLGATWNFLGLHKLRPCRSWLERQFVCAKMLSVIQDTWGFWCLTDTPTRTHLFVWEVLAVLIKHRSLLLSRVSSKWCLSVWKVKYLFLSLSTACLSRGPLAVLVPFVCLCDQCQLFLGCFSWGAKNRKGHCPTHQRRWYCLFLFHRDRETSVVVLLFPALRKISGLRTAALVWFDWWLLMTHCSKPGHGNGGGDALIEVFSTCLLSDNWLGFLVSCQCRFGCSQ